MNNRLAMCLVGPVQLVLAELKPQPRPLDKLVAQLRRLPEFVEATDQAIVLQGQLYHRFTPATDCPPFHGVPDLLSAKWVIIVTLSGHEILAMLGTQFQDRAGDYEFPTDLPLAQLDPFMPLVDDLEGFLGRLDVALMSLAVPQQNSRVGPVLNLEYLPLASLAAN
jgi:hypothetical protein